MAEFDRTPQASPRGEVHAGMSAAAPEGRIRFWIGCDEEHPDAARDFDLDELDEAADWLVETMQRLYPDAEPLALWRPVDRLKPRDERFEPRRSLGPRLPPDSGLARPWPAISPRPIRRLRP